MGNQIILTLEFNGAVLKVSVRYYCGPETKVIYTIKTGHKNHESKKVTHYDHTDYSGDSNDESHSRWKVECPFRRIKKKIFDKFTRNIIEDVGGVMSHEDYSDSDEESPLMGSVYFCYSKTNEESQSLLGPSVRKGILVFKISNTEDTMCHKIRIGVKIQEVT